MTTTSLVRIQCDPASGRAQAFFETKTTVDGETFTKPWEQVSWETGSTKQVTSNGKTLTYAEVLAAVQAIAQQEYDAQP